MTEEQGLVEAPSVKDADERKAVLAQRVAREVAEGWRVESQSDFQVIFAKGKKTNHILHLILTFLTAGLWVIVWIILAIMHRSQQQILTIDNYGNLAMQR